MKKRNFITVFVISMSIIMSITAFASTKVSSVNIKIKAEEDEDDYGLPDLEITTSSKNYSISGYDYTIGLDGNDVEMDTDEEDEDDDQDENNGPGANTKSKSTTTKKETSTKPVTCEITLTAEDDCYFATMTKKNIKINGLDANCTKAARQDSGTTLVLTVQLPGIKTRVGTVDEAGWKTHNIAKWNETNNANTYEIRLYRDGKPFGKLYETEYKQFNFAPLMLKPGTYYYTVRAKDVKGTTGKRFESESVNISEAEANAFKEKYKLEYEIIDVQSGPSVNRNILNGGWQKENGKYWYRMDDGMFPQGNWMLIDNEWYFFDQDGYMITNQWKDWKGKEYYFGSDGKMLKSTKTPDGFKVDEQGEKIH